EVVALARARSIHLPPDLEARALQNTRTFPAEMMPSMAVDLLRGNRLELPWLAGKVVALGRELRIPTPTFDVMYAALKLYANGAPTCRKAISASGPGQTPKFLSRRPLAETERAARRDPGDEACAFERQRPPYLSAWLDQRLVESNDSVEADVLLSK